MMTLFSAILENLGLSQSEAAEYLGVRLDTVKSWSSGRNRVRQTVLAELHALAEKQQSAADAAYAAWEEAGAPNEIEFAVPDEAEINRRGWPSTGAFLAIAARLWSMLPSDLTVNIVRGGSTASVTEAQRLRRIIEPE